MRNAIVFNSSGEYFESTYIGKYNIEDEKFIDEFFGKEGEVLCVPFVESLVRCFELFYPNNLDGLEMLKNIKDPYNIHIIYKSFLFDENGKVNEKIKQQLWKTNTFLDTIYGRQMFADNTVIFVSESELNSFNEVSIEEYNKFIEKILEIIETNKTALDYDYFNKVYYYINDETIISIKDRSELMELKNKYNSGEYGLFTNCIYLNNFNELPYVLIKNGLMSFVDEENNHHYYFTCAKKTLV